MSYSIHQRELLAARALIIEAAELLHKAADVYNRHERYNAGVTVLTPTLITEATVRDLAVKASLL